MPRYLLLLITTLLLTTSGRAAEASAQALADTWRAHWNAARIDGLIGLMAQSSHMRSGYENSKRGRDVISQRLQAMIDVLGPMGEVTVLKRDPIHNLLALQAPFGSDKPQLMPLTFKLHITPLDELEVEELNLGRNLLLPPTQAQAKAAGEAIKGGWNQGFDALLAAHHPVAELRLAWASMGDEQAGMKEAFDELIQALGPIQTITIGDYDAETGTHAAIVRFANVGDKQGSLVVGPWGDHWLPLAFDIR